MNSFRFDIVGFDLDGTLLDTEGDLGAAINHALATIGRPPVPEGETRNLIGGGGRKMLARALEAGGSLPDAEVDSLYGEFMDYYVANIAVRSRPFPGCAAMLDDLERRGAKLAVVTNKLESLAVQVLGELDLLSRFYTVIGGDTLGPGRAKPAPDQLHEMIVRGGGGKAAYVGDTTYDTHAALAAGLPCVGVTFGYANVELAELGATRMIKHFDELVPTLEAL